MKWLLLYWIAAEITTNSFGTVVVTRWERVEVVLDSHQECLDYVKAIKPYTPSTSCVPHFPE